MKLVKLIVVFVITNMLMTSCVTSKKYNALNAELQKAKNDLNDCQTVFAKSQVSNKKLTDQVKDLQSQADESKQQIDSIKAAASSGQLLTTLKDLGIVTPDQAASIDQSLKSMAGSSSSLNNNTLVNNIKNAIGAENDTDVTVVSAKGNIFIDINDHMYFSSGSSVLSSRAKTILEKVAKILNSHPDMHFMIEGHTDTQPMHSGCVPDNWDLSIRRATAVVRILQKEYKVDPTRMIAAGHGEYEPVVDNDTPAHRSQNRRISIVMTPQLDQFFKLLGK
jgi:chemotaxis protein MotB